MDFKPFTIITGHYGCGKTNLSLNIALDRARQGERVTLVDLDIVNPYFRSSDYTELLGESGVRLIAPRYAGTTLDAPALPAEIASIFETEGFVLIDVGGDDVGATALGRYSKRIRERDYDMLYVVNKYRPMTSLSSEAAELLREIEATSHLKATAVVNNSHLMMYTDAETVRSALEFGLKSAEELGLPLKFTTAPRSISDGLEIENLYPVDIYVRTPWMAADNRKD